MSFSFNDDQKLLAESADRFIKDNYSFETRRKIMNSEDGFDREIWKKFCDLGWVALSIPEEYGGLGGTTVDLAVLQESMGKGLVLEPFFSTVVLGVAIIVKSGNTDQKLNILPKIAEGKKFLAFAHTEPRSRFNLNHVATRATRSGDGYVINGRKAVVYHAASADQIVVSARVNGSDFSPDGVTLFLVNRNTPGLFLRSYSTIDGLRASEIQFDDVSVDESSVLGEIGRAISILEAICDRACVLLCAEAAGAMDMAVKLTAEYLKSREQFGVPIGSFQVLQHRSVDMLGAKDFSRALTYRAAGVIDNGNSKDRAKAVSAAKVEMGKAGKKIGQESIQLHGGMGMTDDMSIGHYFKRLTMIDILFGNTDYHINRFAKLV